MCGIGGIYDPRLSHEDLTRRLGAMAQAMRHRGPDDEGLHIDASIGVGLICRRLEIMDPAGGRPAPLCALCQPLHPRKLASPGTGPARPALRQPSP